MNGYTGSWLDFENIGNLSVRYGWDTTSLEHFVQYFFNDLEEENAMAIIMVDTTSL